MKKIVLVHVVMFLLFSFGWQSKAVSAQSDFDPCQDGYSSLCLPDPAAQFAQLPESGGTPLAFSYYHADDRTFAGRDPGYNDRFQSIYRYQEADGTPMLILTRNGSYNADGKHYPGEVVFVELGSKNGAGPLGSNCVSIENDLCQPGEQDRVISTIDLVNGIAGPTGWAHPGSGQIVGNYLFIPMNSPCDSDDARIACSDTQDKYGAILIIDLEKRAVMNTINQDQQGRLEPLATLAVTQTDEDSYFFAGIGLVYNTSLALRTWSYTGDLVKNDLILQRMTPWNANHLLPDKSEDQWKCGSNCGSMSLLYETMNLLRGQDGQLYLLTADNDTRARTDGVNWLRLFLVILHENNITLTFIDQKQLDLSSPIVLGDLSAASGTYVSSEGGLILYTTLYENKGWVSPGCSAPSGTNLCASVQAGEIVSLHDPQTMDMAIFNESGAGPSAESSPLLMLIPLHRYIGLGILAFLFIIAVFLDHYANEKSKQNSYISINEKSDR